MACRENEDGASNDRRREAPSQSHERKGIVPLVEIRQSQSNRGGESRAADKSPPA